MSFRGAAGVFAGWRVDKGCCWGGCGGLFARLYMQKYGVTAEHLAKVAIKNQQNGMLNPYAHIHMKITMEGILSHPDSVVGNPIVADPLRLYDCCPVSDGAAALLLTTPEIAGSLYGSKPPITIAGIGQATDTHALHERADPTDLKAVSPVRTTAAFAPRSTSCLGATWWS